jgi:quinol monooxygenase YgiN
MSSTIPMRLICQEIQLTGLKDLFRESEVRRAAFRGITPEGFAFTSTVKDGDIWVSEYGWEQWRDDRLNDSQLQERHAQKVSQRRREESQ